MRAWFIVETPQRHRFRVERPGASIVDESLETRSMLLHDLAHYALEASENDRHGFYGLLAAGLSIETLRNPDALEPDRLDALMAVERRVARLQSDFKRHGAPASAAGQALRSLWGAWRKTTAGQGLVVEWPDVTPQVAAAPPPPR